MDVCWFVVFVTKRTLLSVIWLLKFAFQAGL